MPVSPPPQGDASLTARLLQALRWRLTRSPPGVARFSVLTDWVQHDVLGALSSQPSLLQVSQLHASACLPADLPHLWGCLSATQPVQLLVFGYFLLHQCHP